MWTNIWAAISALASIATLITAVIAMFRWSRQEQLKAKQDFRKAISLYADYLSQVPNELNEKGLKQSGTELDELTNRYITCAHAWMGTEGLLNKNKIVAESWASISKGQADYLEFKCTARDIGDHCSAIMRTKFVFK